MAKLRCNVTLIDITMHVSNWKLEIDACPEEMDKLQETDIVLCAVLQIERNNF